MSGFRMLHPFLFLSLLTFHSSCNRAGEETPPVEDGTEGVTCVKDVHPSDRAIDASLFSIVIVYFLEEQENPALHLFDSSGHEVSGSTEMDPEGVWMRFIPDEPLTSYSDYTTRIESGECNETFSFTTGDYGMVPVDPYSLIGRAYHLDFESVRFMGWPGVDQLLRIFFGTYILLLGVTDAGDSAIYFMGARGKEEGGSIVQDMEHRTISFPQPADFTSNPYFEIIASTMEVPIPGGAVFVIEDALITGVFSPEGEMMADCIFSGMVDTRALDEYVDGEEGSSCEMAELYGFPCEECPEDGEPFCLFFTAVDIVANEVEGLALVEVEGEEGGD